MDPAGPRCSERSMFTTRISIFSHRKSLIKTQKKLEWEINSAGQIQGGWGWMEQKRTKKCLKTTRKKYSKKESSAVGYRRNTRTCKTPEEKQIKNSSPWQVFGEASTARSVGRMCHSNWLWVAILAASSSASSPPLQWPPPLASHALFAAARKLDLHRFTY